MNKTEFRQLAEKDFLVLDGATGSNLQNAGMPAGVCPEQWILEHEEVMEKLQRDYVKAGSAILYAPTFTANRIKLEEFGLAGRMEQMIHRLVGISKRAAAGQAYVAGDLTMTGRQLEPMGDLSFESLIDVYKEQIRFLAEAGVDLLVIETMLSLQECRAALIAAKETCSLPVMITLSFEKDGRTLYGTDAVTAAVVLEKLGCDAVGANCSSGPQQMSGVIAAMAEAVSIPIIAKPNAGLPCMDAQGNTFYDMGPEAFAGQMLALIEAGAGILGGCCGTSPQYIETLVRELEGWKEHNPDRERRRCLQGRHYLASEQKCLDFGPESPFLIVGERINPTGKKKLQAELREGSFELVKQLAREQESKGAAVLDVNLGMSGIDEKGCMLKAIEEIMTVTALPLCFDSSHTDVLEAAMRRYPGRALINSISLEKEKIEKLLPLVKKYGAMFILLPLSEKGLPENAEDKIEIINQIVGRAVSMGMSKEDIIVDGLVTTAGANKNAAEETLAAIRFCKREGLSTVCGLSNISFGLPERSFINTAFLIMAIKEGLTMAIANPSQELLVNSAAACDLLLNKKNADTVYIERMNQRKEKPVSEPAADTQDAAGQADIRKQIYEAVLKGNRSGIGGLVTQALEEKTEAQTILNELLLPAINEVGRLFDEGRYFLPQLIAGAEAMKNAIGLLEPLLLTAQRQQSMPVVVIATVEGDIHDIGKNLVSLMLKNYGFQVIDLGKDVPKETIIQAAKEHNASIIALSALMTTTMQQMKQVVNYARQEGVTAKIMIGGAVITQEYADEIGADGYSEDAAQAVKVARRLLENV